MEEEEQKEEETTPMGHQTSKNPIKSSSKKCKMEYNNDNNDINSLSFPNMTKCQIMDSHFRKFLELIKKLEINIHSCRCFSIDAIMY